ncbi:MAG: RluA family pseudouridine synthase [Fibrobacteria bacterium]|nr:RluA family pseudouridine synthase [Fibrobacteria bacterium]
MPLVNTSLSLNIKQLTEDCELLDYLCVRFPYQAHDKWKNLINDGLVEVNGSHASPETPLKKDDVITYNIRNYQEPDVNINFRIVHRDDKLLMVHKPAGLPVHRTGKIFVNTLVNLVREHEDSDQLTLVNRLDAGTSGIVVFAREKSNAKYFSPMSPGVHWDKLYCAVIRGNLPNKKCHSNKALKERPGNKIRCQMFEEAEGKSASSQFYTIEEKNGYSLIIAAPITGRKHQLRAHLSGLGTPIIGDKIYSCEGKYYLKQIQQSLSQIDLEHLGAPHQLLHCFYCAITPASGNQRQCVDWEPGEDFTRYFNLDRVRKWWGSKEKELFLNNLRDKTE